MWTILMIYKKRQAKPTWSETSQLGWKQRAEKATTSVVNADIYVPNLRLHAGGDSQNKEGSQTPTL